MSTTEQFAKLSRILGQSRSPLRKHSWDSVEHQLGLRLPTDYKGWGDKYASLALGNAISVTKFACIGAGVREEVIKSLTGLINVMRVNGVHRVFGQYGDIVESDVPAWSVYPDSPGLLGWGSISGGFDLMWYTEGYPDSWKIVVSNDSDDLHVYDCGFVEFLLMVIDNELGPRLDSSRWMNHLSIEEMWGYKAVSLVGREFKAIDFRPINEDSTS